MASSLVETPIVFLNVTTMRMFSNTHYSFYTVPFIVCRCFVSLSERLIASMPYARIGLPIVFQTNAFNQSSELMPGYDIPNEANLNIPCRHF